MDQLALFEEVKEKEIILVKGGIYIDKGIDINDPDTEFMISFGRAFHVIFDGIYDIDDIVEIGGNHRMEYVDGYCLSLKKDIKEWRIKDTGHKQCRHILRSGKYHDGFEDSLKPYLKIFHK